MSKKIVPVLIRWHGERAVNPPTTARYVSVAKFPEDKSWEISAWSVVLELDADRHGRSAVSKGVAYFLAPDAPEDQLRQGVVFEMYEGATKSAEVEIIRNRSGDN